MTLGGTLSFMTHIPGVKVLELLFPFLLKSYSFSLTKIFSLV
jgi:hypothetical protein